MIILVLMIVHYLLAEGPAALLPVYWKEAFTVSLPVNVEWSQAYSMPIPAARLNVPGLSLSLSLYIYIYIYMYLFVYIHVQIHI